MAQKQCASPNCEETFERVGARKFCDLHATGKKKGSTRGAKKPPPEADGITVVGIDLSEKQLDRIWSGSTIEEKGLAVQAILECQRNEE